MNEREHESKVKPNLSPAVRELISNASRYLILLTGGMSLMISVLALAETPQWLYTGFGAALLVSVLSSLLALRLLASRLTLALIYWQIGIALYIMLVLHVTGWPEVILFYALLPLIAVITIDWRAGLVAEIVLCGLIWGVPHVWAMPPVPTSYAWATVLFGAVAGMLAWAAMSTLLTTTYWSLKYCYQALDTVDGVRNQRLEFKQIQRDLVQANQELARLSNHMQTLYYAAEESRRAKEEFVANVSHELRTPLNMIIGFSEMIIQSPQVYGARLPAALLADITAIYRNSQHLARLVDDVLDLSRIEAGRFALSKEWASVQDIITEATTAVQALYVAKGLHLEVEIEPDLPPVFCDSTRIRQVVLNLLSNAGRFTEQGGVKVRAWSENDTVLVSVSDTGPGIAPEDQQRLFEPFQQVDSFTHNSHGGSGLGLSISKRFVEMHGGRIWLESEVGAGTTFTFCLPLQTRPTVPQDAGGEDTRRWFHPYNQYEYRARSERSKAPAPIVLPRFVLLDRGQTLEWLLSRYLRDVELVYVPDIEALVRESGRAPTQMAIANVPPSEATALRERFAGSPYNTPLVTYWVPGRDDLIRDSGITGYLVKPVTRERLLSALDELGPHIRRILLVDDNAEILQLFTRLLYSSGRDFEILQARNGLRALDLLRQRKPDVMLLDLVMATLDGFQMLQEKKQDAAIQDIPVIIVSARDLTSESLICDALTITRSGGLSVHELLTCIKTISQVLCPQAWSDGQAHPGKPAA